MSTDFAWAITLASPQTFSSKPAEIDGLQIEAGGAGALAGDEEEVVDEQRQMLRLLDDAGDRVLVFGNRLVLPRSTISPSPRMTVSGVRSS